MNKFRAGLTLRISLVFFCFAALLLLGVGILSYTSIHKALESAAVSELLSSALGKEARIDEWVRNTVSDVETKAIAPDLIESLASFVRAADGSTAAREAHDRLNTELVPRTQLLIRRNLLVGIADVKNGRLIYASNPLLEGSSISTFPYYNIGLTKTYVQHALVSDLLNRPAITIGTPIRTPAGEVLGVLAVWIDLTELNSVVQQRTGLHQTDDTYLVNPSHQFVTQPRFMRKDMVLRDKISTEAIERALTGNSGTLRDIDYKGEPAFIIYRWLPDQKLALISLIDQREALAAASEFGVAMLLISALMLLLACGIAIGLARTIVFPIRALQEGVNRFGMGEFNLRLPDKSGGELGQLTREFNNMADSINEKGAQLVDNTAKLELRVKLRTSALQRQADLLELAHDAIIVRQPDGTIEFWNHGAQEIYGWRSSEVIGQLAQSVLRTRLTGTNQDFAAELLATGRWEGELLHHRRDGTAIIVASRQAVRYDEQGMPAAILEINSDISKRKHAEEQLTKAKEEAEAATHAKSDFLANMSHEIRTPMNGVIGLTNLILKTPLSLQQREYLSLIKGSAGSLLRLLNDILDFSKMEANKLELDLIQFNLRDILGNTLKAFSATANEKSLELIYHVMPDIPALLEGDPGRLAQIIVNLTGNALKFTKQGEVVVRVRLQSRTEHFLTLQFSVSDSGIGISPDQKAMIFNAFAQADTSTTRQFGGTGLGLTIVTQLVKLMQGRVWIDSTPGIGTTIHFTAQFGLLLPSQQPALREKPIAGLENMAILVVDDNRTNRMILAEILSNWEMHPVLAADGTQALQLMQQRAEQGDPFRLVLLDAQMPNFSGFELFEALHANTALSTATVMMLSSGDLEGELTRCAVLGARHMLHKPIKQSELFDAIVNATGVAAINDTETRTGSALQSIKTSHPLHVLIAEDNPVNQRLVMDILQERGHTYSLAVNGIDVLYLLDLHKFDVILMDGQMPEMDGYQTTQEIRRREQSSGRHIRIVAVTAHAMKQDRERCLAVGMDDYISKPIDADKLIASLEQVPTDAVLTLPLALKTSPSQPVVFDLQAALKRVRGKDDLLKELITVLLQDMPHALADIDTAVTNRDAQLLERTAHRLRGASSTVCAEAVACAVGQLEELSRAAAFDVIPQVVLGLHRQAAELLLVMKNYLETA